VNTKRVRLPLLAAVVVVLVASCAPRRALFEPAEAATALSPEGYVAAHYTLFTDVGRLGEAKVWSQGAYPAEMAGEQRTVLHVGFEIENYSRVPIRLEPEDVYLDSATINRSHIRNIPVASAVGLRSVRPETVGHIDLYFVLPRNVQPANVNAFRVRWTIRNGGVTYSQRTPFLEAPARYAAVAPYYYSPFYDPFYADPFLYRPRTLVVYHRPFVHVHRVPTDRIHVRRFPR
jgi:hypothetical protein